MSAELAALRAKRQKTRRSVRTVTDLETETTSYLGVSAVDLSAEDVQGLSRHVFEFEQHLNAVSMSLDDYSVVIFGFSGTKADEKEFQSTEMDWIEEMHEFIRAETKKLVSLKFILNECGKGSAATVTSPPTVQVKQENDERLDKLLSEMVEMNKNTQSVVMQSMRSAPSKQSDTVKLPKLELVTFDGDIMKFKEFRDMFQATVHTKNSLADVEKLSYLRSHLKGKALDCISGLALTNANYKVAWDLISERFGKAHVVINARYMALVELEKPSSRPESLRKYLNEVEANIRSLDALQENTSQALLIPLITSKLPKSVMTQLEIKKGNATKWTVKSLREALGNFVDALEAAESVTAGNDRIKDHPIKVVGTHSVVAQATQNPNPVTRKCIYCTQSHYADECTKFADAVSRKLQLEGRCYICLKTGHDAKACRNAKPCFYCKRTTHHCSICPVKFGTSTGESGGTSTLNHQAAPFRPSTTMGVAVADDSNAIMQTAVATVYNSDSTQSLSARIFFDTGASRTFITEALSNKLQCNEVGKDTVSVASFGKASRKTEVMPRVNLLIEHPDKTCKEVTVNVTPVTCCPIHRFPLPNDEKLHNLPLAEKPVQTAESCNVDILMGLDYYHDFIHETSTTLQNGIRMVKSVFGYLPSGSIETTSPGIETEVLTAVSTADHDEAYFDIEKFWKLEHVGIEDESEEVSLEEQIEDQFKESVRFVNGRYFVSWPWKGDSDDLPENYELAYGRLKSLINRIGKTPEVLVQYNKIIQEQIEAGIVERVTEESEQHKPHHYIPHHCIAKPGSSTTKLRIVYDASAKPNKKSTSLNDSLE